MQHKRSLQGILGTPGWAVQPQPPPPSLDSLLIPQNLQAGTLPPALDLSGGLTQQLAALAATVGVDVPGQDSVHVKGLPQNISDERVRSVFSSYGQVAQVKVARFADGCSALLKMGNGEMAKWLVENLNGHIPQGLSSPVAVSFADQAKFAKSTSSNARVGPYAPVANAGHPKFDMFPTDVQTALNCAMTSLGGKTPGGKDAGSVAVTVKDLPGTADDLYVYKIFAPFGSLESVAVKRDPEGAWAVAFVKFLAADGAQRAEMALNGCVLPDGAMLKVTLKAAAAK